MNENTPQQQARWSARQLATMALFAALGALLAQLQLPIFPLAASIGITYDPSNVPAMIGGLAFGPSAGLIIGILSAVARALMSGDVVGMCMNIVAVVGFVAPASLIYKRKRTTGQLIIGLVVGVIVSVALIIPANLIVWPQFYHVPMDYTLSMIVPLMLPFNLMKATINAVLSFLLYKSLRSLLES